MNNRWERCDLGSASLVRRSSQRLWQWRTQAGRQSVSQSVSVFKTRLLYGEEKTIPYLCHSKLILGSANTAWQTHSKKHQTFLNVSPFTTLISSGQTDWMNYREHWHYAVMPTVPLCWPDPPPGPQTHWHWTLSLVSSSLLRPYVCLCGQTFTVNLKQMKNSLKSLVDACLLLFCN